MLDKTFKHKHWFIGRTMTVKEFLDYVLSHDNSFYVKEKFKSNSDNLMADLESIFYLKDDEGRYSYKLNQEEIKYLSDNNEYFKYRFTE